MVTVRLSSGLGNQLFQYAFALYLKQKCGLEVQFDINCFNFDDSRVVEISIVNSNINFIKNTQLFTNFQSIKYRLRFLLFKINPRNIYINDKRIFQNTIFNKSKNYYFDGYWQTDFYISKIKDISDFFKPQDFIPFFIKNYIFEMEKCNSVVLHVRRGDYFSPLYINRYGVCNAEYYLRAIKYIQTNVENPMFFVFSDDLDWVSNNVELPANTVLIKNEKINSFWYVFLMSKAKHNIISNSTFSWWGAYLNMNDEKIIIAPDKWMLDTDATLALEDWIKIPVN
jgi:hypothetical protein